MAQLRATLPILQKPLIGRANELQLAKGMLLGNDVPWLTLTGTGGVGKTHLALSLANTIASSYEQVAFVPLAALNEPELVLSSIAHGLGLAEPSERALLSYLAAFEEPRQLLLVIDNCEHVASGFNTPGRILTGMPGVQVLATSRAPLHLTGEHILPVAPLDLPVTGHSFEQIKRTDSVAFFINSARASQPDFDITPANARAVMDICATLDGLPLALELAAARLRIISPDALRSLLTDRLDVLVGGPRDAPLRQRTLRDAINWSYGLLSDREQRLLEQLSVFAGGFDLSACADVAGEDALTMLDRLEALVDHGLIVPTHSGEQPRFRMLATIREFAFERLIVSGTRDATREAHARHFARLARKLAPELTGPNQGVWNKHLELELNNFRSANAWLSEANPENAEAAELRVGLANDLWRFWVTRGLLSEGRSWLKQAINAPGFATVNRPLQGRAHQQLGNMALDQGDMDAAQANFDANRAICDEIEDRAGIAAARNGLGLVAYYRGDYARARHHHEIALEIRRTLTEPVGLGNSLHNLGVTANAERDYERAIQLVREGMQVRRGNGDHGAVGYSVFVLADIAFNQGKLDAARNLLDQSGEMFQQLGDQLGIAYVRSTLGFVLHDKGDEQAAAEHFAAALSIRKGLGDRRGCLESIEGVSALLPTAAQAEMSVTLSAVAATARKTFGLPARPIEADRYERELARRRALLNTSRFSTAWTAGEALSLDDAIDQAIDAAKAMALSETGSRPAGSTRGAHATKTALLTRRERDVLRLLSQGKANAEIADELFIGQRTVETHVGNILTKLEVRSRSAAVAIAIQERL